MTKSLCGTASGIVVYRSTWKSLQSRLARTAQHQQTAYGKLPQKTLHSHSHSNLFLRHLCWDLNGNRNERVVATSLICLRRENIDPDSGGISFRTDTKRNAWEDRPNECQCSDPEVVAGPSSAAPGPPTTPDQLAAEDEEQIPSFQELGTVQLPEGRIVTYPNTLQHKFEIPQLKRPNKPGSLQLLQIHLVDPHYIVCSTQFVPPQSLEWWKEAIDYERICLENQIPLELSEIIIENLFIPEIWLNKKRKRFADYKIIGRLGRYPLRIKTRTTSSSVSYNKRANRR